MKAGKHANAQDRGSLGTQASKSLPGTAAFQAVYDLLCRSIKPAYCEWKEPLPCPHPPTDQC